MDNLQARYVHPQNISRNFKPDRHIIFKHFLGLMRLIYVAFILLMVLITSAQSQQTAEAWFNKGVALNSQGKYDEAIKAYDKAIEIDPQYADAWYNKGTALYMQGKVNESFQAYFKATELSKPSAGELWQKEWANRLRLIVGLAIFLFFAVGVLLLAVWKTESEQKRLIWIAIIYDIILLGIMGIASIVLWNYPHPPVIIAFVPVEILEWSFMGGMVAVLYHLAYKQKNLEIEFVAWIIAKPIIGLVMGGVVYFIALGTGVLLGINQNGINQNLLPQNTIYLLCTFAFIAGFSDRFSIDLINRLVSKSTEKELREK